MNPSVFQSLPPKSKYSYAGYFARATHRPMEKFAFMDPSILNGYCKRPRKLHYRSTRMCVHCFISSLWVSLKFFDPETSFQVKGKFLTQLDKYREFGLAIVRRKTLPIIFVLGFQRRKNKLLSRV